MRSVPRKNSIWILFYALSILPCVAAENSSETQPLQTDLTIASEFIRPSSDGTHFVTAESGRNFVAWGFNYDHDSSGRLLEDYWYDEWNTVVEDFQEMKARVPTWFVYTCNWQNSCAPSRSLTAALSSS